jgi:hypothetical protein
MKILIANIATHLTRRHRDGEQLKENSEPGHNTARYQELSRRKRLSGQVSCRVNAV